MGDYSDAVENPAKMEQLQPRMEFLTNRIQVQIQVQTKFFDDDNFDDGGSSQLIGE